MQREAKSVSDSGAGRQSAPERPTTANAERIASLARLNFNAQNRGLFLPRLDQQPAVYSHAVGDDISVTLAESFIKLGLGTMEQWKEAGNCTRFIAAALNGWLHEIGADSLSECVDLAVAFHTEYEHEKFKDGQIFVTIETSASGCTVIGNAIRKLEKHAPGLGADFYSVFCSTLYRWMRIYDHSDAEHFVERWTESIDRDPPFEGLSFEEYCAANEIHIPDVEGSIPPPIKNSKGRADAAARRLRKHANGRYGKWINTLLEVWAIRPKLEIKREKFDFEWDDAPLPTWVVFFEEHDAISQCFDEEAASYYECSHEPTWFNIFAAADHIALGKVLSEVERFVRVIQGLVRLNELMLQESETDK
jgi:hypothetical protein